MLSATILQFSGLIFFLFLHESASEYHYKIYEEMRKQ